MALQFGQSRLPELLDARRMSQADFARRLGVSEGFVTQIVTGKSRFSLLTAKRAAKILGCKIDDLYVWIEEGNR